MDVTAKPFCPPNVQGDHDPDAQEQEVRANCFKDGSLFNPSISCPVLFLFQIAVILGVSHLIATVFRSFAQPRVAGEMAAGILLGPTVFGWFAPGAYGWLFPSESLGSWNALSQTGLVIFVFLIGSPRGSGGVAPPRRTRRLRQ